VCIYTTQLIYITSLVQCRNNTELRRRKKVDKFLKKWMDEVFESDELKEF
tara:strand:- start:321 stop:470 length:150 start_codon:yes stop_codon:yes gene_type:complete